MGVLGTDFEKSEILGRAEAVKVVPNWRVCADEGDKGCLEGTYYNELTCSCFSVEQCTDLTCPAGQNLTPDKDCTCAADTDIKLFYPEWATEE